MNKSPIKGIRSDRSDPKGPVKKLEQIYSQSTQFLCQIVSASLLPCELLKSGEGAVIIQITKGNLYD